MSTTDPIADMLTCIRNAGAVRKAFTVFPASRIKLAIAHVLEREGYVARVEEVRDGKFPAVKVHLKYTEDRKSLVQSIKRISKPGCRVYSKARDLRPVLDGLGICILSTSRGVISDREARQKNLGGEVLCEVW